MVVTRSSRLSFYLGKGIILRVSPLGTYHRQNQAEILLESFAISDRKPVIHATPVLHVSDLTWNIEVHVNCWTHSLLFCAISEMYLRSYIFLCSNKIIELISFHNWTKLFLERYHTLFYRMYIILRKISYIIL